MTVQDWNQSEEKNQLIAFVAAVDIAEKRAAPTSSAHPASHQKQTSLDLILAIDPSFPPGSSWGYWQIPESALRVVSFLSICLMLIDASTSANGHPSSVNPRDLE